MTKEQWLEEFEKELDEWLATEDHLYECIGYSEGCACCLDEKHGIYGGAGREWVIAFIKKAREEAKRERTEEIIQYIYNLANGGTVEMYAEYLLNLPHWFHQKYLKNMNEEN